MHTIYRLKIKNGIKMKTLKFIAALFVIATLTAGTTVFAEEKTKAYNESWPVDNVSSLEIINRFGEIRINNEGGTEVTIDVLITVEAATERKTDELLNKIEVKFSKSGGTVKAETQIDADFKSQKNFSIDYVINIPSDRDLNISNKYGNTIVSKLTGNGDFNVKYGNFNAYELLTPESGNLNLNMAYGDANIGKASFLNVEVSYSPITIEELNKLTIESKYSTINIEKANEINIESKYDKFAFEEVASVTATTKYSNIKIDELGSSLKVESGYGSIKVNALSSEFEFINITNSYGQISLGLDNANYSLDASCDYCGITYPEESFSGNKIKDGNTSTLQGQIGTGQGGKVYLRSRYGDIKLKN